jgi:hypothetical protein
MGTLFERTVAAIVALLAVWRFAVPVEKCPISSGPVLYFETYRWLPWTGGCRWGYEVDVWGTALQVVVLMFAAGVVLWISRSRPVGRLGPR